MTSVNRVNGINSGGSCGSSSNNNIGPTSTTATTTPAGKDWSSGKGIIPGRDVLGPILLMVTTPIFSIVYFHVCCYENGNFLSFGQRAVQTGFVKTVYGIWPNPWDGPTWKMILSFMAFQLALMKLVPGQRFEATLTPAGHVPVYRANGMACYLITLGTLLLLAVTGTFDPAVVYDKFGNILSSMNVFAWAFCFGLLFKGYRAPSDCPDRGTNGNIVQDFYWGMELYPRVLDWDVKQFTNCRCGMMFWAVAVVSFCFKNAALHGNSLQAGMAVSAVLQLVYITKFFHWEMGYMCSMDIQHDRAGYYLCWGCLVWVPAVYTSQAFYLTKHCPDYESIAVPALIFAAGLFCIWANYDSDRQRYVFRKTAAKCTIWGRSPPRHIVAEYSTTTGQRKRSLLLVDGWWSVSRHFHYVPEIMAAFFWSAPAANTAFVAPYFYVVYLTILLTDRAFRDDDRCSKKYGRYWKEYCDTVPYKMIPGLV